MNKANLFSDLGKCRRAEDHLTNCLVGLIKQFLENEALEEDRVIGLNILNLIALKEGDPEFTASESIKITSQLRADDESQPDITISSHLHDGRTREIYIEVKDSAPVKPGQLVKYRGRLEDKILNSHSDIICLTLLSRPLVRFEELNDQQAVHSQVYWPEIYDILAESTKRTAVSKYLVNSFCQFLEEKNMKLNKTSGDFSNPAALEDLVEFLKLLETTLKGIGFSSSPVEVQFRTDLVFGGKPQPWIGFNRKYNRREFSVGLYTYRPAELEITLLEDSTISGEPCPTEYLKLEETNFFELSLGEQMKFLKSEISHYVEQILEKNPKKIH